MAREDIRVTEPGAPRGDPHRDAMRCCAASRRCRPGSYGRTATSRPGRRASPGPSWPDATIRTCRGTGSCERTGRWPKESVSAKLLEEEEVPFRGDAGGHARARMCGEAVLVGSMAVAALVAFGARCRPGRRPQVPARRCRRSRSPARRRSAPRRRSASAARPPIARRGHRHGRAQRRARRGAPRPLRRQRGELRPRQAVPGRREGDRPHAAGRRGRPRRRVLVHRRAAAVAEHGRPTARCRCRRSRPPRSTASARAPTSRRRWCASRAAPAATAPGLHLPRAVLAQGQPAARRPADHRRPRRPRVVQAGPPRHGGHRPQGPGLGGEPVITWWEGRFAIGWGYGAYKVFDSSYRQVATISPATATSADLHDMQLTDRGTALLLAYDRVKRDLRRVGGQRRGIVLDNVVQEVDLATGLVVFEWHSLGPVPLDESRSRPDGAQLVRLLPRELRRGRHGREPDRLRPQHLHAVQAGPRRRLDHVAARRREERLPDGQGHALLLPARRAALGARPRSRCSTTPPARPSCASSRAGSAEGRRGGASASRSPASTSTPAILAPNQGSHARAAQRQRVRRLGRGARVLGVQPRRAGCCSTAG